MRRVLTIAALLLVGSTRFVHGQVQTPMHVGPFGGISDSLPALDMPPELKAFIPSGFTLRATMMTKMAPNGEEIFLYDDGEDVFPEIHLHALHDRKDFSLFDRNIMAVRGLLPVTLHDGTQLLGFAYGRAGDGADTRFVIFSFENQGYRSIFERATTEGRMRVLSSSPLRFEVWSADETMDKAGESCVWCAHRYRVITYEFNGDSFDVIGMRTTRKYLDPSEVANGTFIVVSQK